MSKNYCGYGDGLVQPVGFKTIRRIEVEGKDETGRGVRQQFYDYVAESTKPISGMVYANGDTEGSVEARIKEARETAVVYRDTFRFLTRSWSAGKLDIFTSPRDLQTAIENIKIRNGQNVLVKGFVKIGPENQGVVHYKGKGITDYPRLVTTVMEALREVSPNNGFFKSILFGREMVARGVPVCGTNHMRHLDCALIIMPGESCENVIQVFGRLCAVIEASVSSKMEMVVFSPKRTHHIHRSALATTNFCSRAFAIMAEGGPSALEKLESMRREVVEGNLVEDVDGIIDLFKTRLTRPGPQCGAKIIATEIENLQRQHKKQRQNEMERTGAPDDPLQLSDEPGTGDAGERDAQSVDSMEVALASVEGVVASAQKHLLALIGIVKETIEMYNGPSSTNDVLSAGENKPITSAMVKDLADNRVEELVEVGLMFTADNGMFCLCQMQQEEQEQEQGQEAGESPVQASAAVGVGEVVSVGGAAGDTTGEEEEKEEADGEPEMTIGEYVAENRGVLVDIFSSCVKHYRHG